ncbi:MAG TPA: NAD(P)-dependent oxidoreductase, partial [Lactobacillus sp.]|nr:NAD(P)-dependent oxidoreductase [Lactobacillus sp.]
ATDITRGDVAQFITAVLADPATIHQAYDIVNGQQNIAELLN